MKRALCAAAGLAALALAGCAAGEPDLAPMAAAPAMASVSTDVREPGGRLVARSTATEIGDGVRIRIEAAGLARGTYGAHIHTTGRCDPPGFESAGGHWNPTNRRHGSQDPQGQHKGDLPNLMVGSTGQGSLEYTIPGVQLTGGATDMLDADGAALVIHAGADDYRTDPSGNSGARIACGVFR